MKFRSHIPLESAMKRTVPSICSFICLLSAAFFIGNVLFANYRALPSFPDFYCMKLTGMQTAENLQNVTSKCEPSCKAHGSETLPKGIIASTTDLTMRPLWGSPEKERSNSTMNLLAIAAGIKQKENVNKIVEKFISSEFVVVLFHYDGNVDGWRDLKWSDQAIHVSAINQTKWWFAKRFLHPDIISEYAYIFLWDEDLGVEHFNVQRYLSVVKEEGLEISQPALDPNKSEVHHWLTRRESALKVHRRIYKKLGDWMTCDENSTEPPCTGWVEIMAPAFSQASWRCVWHMIQNDLIHGWGLDFQLGYCAKGDRTKKVGVVDSEYLVHAGTVTLGNVVAKQITTSSGSNQSPAVQSDTRTLIRNRSFAEWRIFLDRWGKAVQEDECWVDPYKKG